MDTTTVELLRLARVQARIGLKHSALYTLINKGLLPPPVRLGPRVSVWPSNEIDQVVGARIAGWNDDQIRELVAQLVELRPAFAPALPAEAA